MNDEENGNEDVYYSCQDKQFIEMNLSINNKVDREKEKEKEMNNKINIDLNIENLGYVETIENIEFKFKKYNTNHNKIKSKTSKELINSSFSNTDICTDQEKILIYTVTWNMYGRTANQEDLKHLLLKDNFYHIYAIGSEECMRSILFSFFYTDKSSWEKMVQDHLGPDYVLLKSENMYAIHQVVFTHRSVLPFIKSVGSLSVKTGFYNFTGNKGAVYIWFTYKDVSFLFINCHLAAGHLYSNKRNQDFQRILSGCCLPLDVELNPIIRNLNTLKQLNILDKVALNENKNNKKNKNENENENEVDSNDISEKFNVTFFMGDFNYRIDHNISFISESIKFNNIKDILKHDQMNIEIKEGRLNNQKFKEGKISFNPTYKYIAGTDLYTFGNGDKIPGWTDRIMYIIRFLINI